MKILYIATESWFFVSHFLDRAIEAKKAGFEIYVIAKNSGSTNQIEDAGIRFINFDIGRGLVGSMQFISSIIRLRKIIRSLKPEIIHNIALKVIITSNLASAGLKYCTHINAPVGFGYMFSSSDFVAGVLRILFNVTVKAIVQINRSIFIIENNDDLRYIINRGWVNAQHAFLIEGAGVDLVKFNFTPLPTGNRIVVLVARMLKDKGVNEFVDAARMLKRKWPDVVFRLVGDSDPGNPSSIPSSKINSWVAEGCVEWLGYKKNIDEILRESWLVCLPSYREGLPKSLIEAMASGRPIVTCDVPGCKSLVDHGINGLLVPARQVLPLVDAIEILLANPELAQKYGSRGRAIAEDRLSREIVNAQTLLVYKKIYKNECV